MLSVAIACLPVSCSSDNEEAPEQNDFDIRITLPSVIEVEHGSDCVFPLEPGHGILATDIIQLESKGLLYSREISAIDDNSLSFSLPKGLADGTYNIYVKRGERKKAVGSVVIKLIAKKFPLEEGSTVYGTVTCGDEPVEGVLVSDGFEFARTNAEGQYQMASSKENGYVFVVLPSGYEAAELKGVIPQYFVTLMGDAKSAENASFKLKKVDQSRHKILYLGDMHLANRNNDISQYTAFAKDLNNYYGAHASEKMYVMTLGDMSWDIYWYSNNYSLDNYLKTANELFSGMQFFHTIGNHDNDYKTTTNELAKAPFRKIVGPNYYSLNIGDVHYVFLDDIDCSTYDGTDKRNYVERLFGNQLAWLTKDLSYVDKSTPVVVLMHAPAYSPLTATLFAPSLKGLNDILAVLDGYNVHFVTGHTHKNYNVTPSQLGGKTIHEHNVGAVCSDWWWSGKLSGILLSTDGTPSGYCIANVNGKDMTWDYKTVGKDISHQFRSYDLNKVKFSMEQVPNLVSGSSAYNKFKEYVKAYPGDQKNEVLLNVWNYNPDWKVSVSLEDGTALEVKSERDYDPLHIEAMSLKRFKDATTSTPNFVTQNQPHFFRVTCPDATSTLLIKVSDDHGNMYTETMTRPKAFSVADYK